MAFIVGRWLLLSVPFRHLVNLWLLHLCKSFRIHFKSFMCFFFKINSHFNPFSFSFSFIAWGDLCGLYKLVLDGIQCKFLYHLSFQFWNHFIFDYLLLFIFQLDLLLVMRILAISSLFTTSITKHWTINAINLKNFLKTKQNWLIFHHEI